MIVGSMLGHEYGYERSSTPADERLRHGMQLHPPQEVPLGGTQAACAAAGNDVANANANANVNANADIDTGADADGDAGAGPGVDADDAADHNDGSGTRRRCRVRPPRAAASSRAWPTRVLTLLAAAALLPAAVSACYIQGVDSGECRRADEIAAEMPFCGPYVRYDACVPRAVSWMPNHTLANKDLWAERAFAQVLNLRLEQEANGGT